MILHSRRLTAHMQTSAPIVSGVQGPTLLSKCTKAIKKSNAQCNCPKCTAFTARPRWSTAPHLG